jgi:hypothetical protein
LVVQIVVRKLDSAVVRRLKRSPYSPVDSTDLIREDRDAGRKRKSYA